MNDLELCNEPHIVSNESFGDLALTCCRLSGHDGNHVFRVEWGDLIAEERRTPGQQAVDWRLARYDMWPRVIEQSPEILVFDTDAMGDHDSLDPDPFVAMLNARFPNTTLVFVPGAAVSALTRAEAIRLLEEIIARG